jgi:purine-binding chemotaxis protein CheW
MARKKRVAAQVRTVTTVAFVLGREECAVPITDVHQIIRDVPVTPVPNVNEHVEGVLNLRGVVVPILDLKHRLGLGVRTLGPRHRLLILEIGGRLVGFSVDAVTGVLEFEESALQPPPDIVLARMEAGFIRGVVTRADSVVILLDTKEVLNVHTTHPAADAHAAVARAREY